MVFPGNSTDDWFIGCSANALDLEFQLWFTIAKILMSTYDGAEMPVVDVCAILKDITMCRRNDSCQFIDFNYGSFQELSSASCQSLAIEICCLWIEIDRIAVPIPPSIKLMEAGQLRKSYMDTEDRFACMMNESTVWNSPYE